MAMGKEYIYDISNFGFLISIESKNWNFDNQNRNQSKWSKNQNQNLKIIDSVNFFYFNHIMPKPMYTWTLGIEIMLIY